MHLLFISSNRIGDSLINLQVLNKYIRKNKKNIEVTLVSGSLPMPIYDDYTMISKRVILTKQKYNLHWFKLYKELSAFRYDEIVDFRSSLIGYFLRVKKRNIFVATDVFPEEPVPKKSSLRKVKNILFSAHRAGALKSAFFNMGEIVLKDMSLIRKNLKPKFCKIANKKTVNPVSYTHLTLPTIYSV